VADRDGPWAAALFYSSHDFRCCFLSDPRTRHARAIAVDPRAAATIQDQPEDWTAIRGIQIEGEAHRLSGRARAAALARYLTRFRGAAADRRLVGAFRRAAVYELVPNRLEGQIDGVALVVADADACPPCLGVTDRSYLPSGLPPLPIVACSRPGGCRCRYEPNVTVYE